MLAIETPQKEKKMELYQIRMGYGIVVLAVLAAVFIYMG